MVEFEKARERERLKFQPGQRVKILKISTMESGYLKIAEENGLKIATAIRGGKYLLQGMIKYAGRPNDLNVYEVILDEVGKEPIADIENARIEGRVTVYGEEIELL